MSRLVLETTKQKAGDFPIVLTAGIGLFLSTLDTGIINVALPTIQTVFHASVKNITWSITLYLLVLSATIVFFGRLSDRLGHVRVYSWGLGLFAAASILCGLAYSASQLACFRAFQGVGAAMLQATAVAIITKYVPAERRGTALGTLGMMIGLGPVIGPSVGGGILSLVGWRWVFWINPPICLMGLVCCARLPKTARGTKLHNSYEGSRHVIRTLFKSPAFSAPLFAVTVLGISTSVAFIVPPYFLERVSGIAPWQVGLVNLASPLGLVLLSRSAGKNIKSWGTVRLMRTGLGMMLIALLALSFMRSGWEAVWIACLLFLYGAGAGIFVPPNLMAIMSSVPSELQGTIGGIQRMLQNTGICLGASVAATIIQNHARAGSDAMMSGFRDTWMFAAGTVVLSLLGMTLLRRRRK